MRLVDTQAVRTPVPPVLAAIGVLIACDHDPVSLIDHSAWELVEAAEDPWDDRPTEASCAPLGFFTESLGEEESLQVDTGLCPYLTIRQPSLAAVQEGDSLHLRLWHYPLTGDGGAEVQEAHAALRIDGVVVWDERVPIPQTEGGLLSPRWLAEAAAEEGAEIAFHLHNHGSNSWNLIEISDARCGGEICE
jgi:hypothetical protein